MRRVVAGGIALAGRPRRLAASQPNRITPAPQAPASPLRPRRPRTATPVPPFRPGWFARWFGFGRHHPASLCRPGFAAGDHTPFTPEAYPGLSPEACAFFNTPVEECDPETLHATLSVLAVCIADSMPPELGMDARALFSTFRGRLGLLAGEAPPDIAVLDAEPAPVPATPADAVPDAPPGPVFHTQAAESADAAATTAIATREAAPDTAIATPAARQIPPDTTSPTEPAARFGRAAPDGSRSFRYRRRSLVDCCRSRLHRLLSGEPHRPPQRRLCYAACAGPR